MEEYGRDEDVATGEKSMSRNNETGQVLVLAALTLTVLMLAAGLAIDMGYLRYQKRRMQTAADSAAIAGAKQLTGDYTDAAIADASLNGFTITPSEVSNQLPCPDGTQKCVQVQVSQAEPTFFMRIVGDNAVTVSALATAEQVPGPGCIYALSSAGDAITVGTGYNTMVVGTTCEILDNGGLIVNSNQTVYVESILTPPNDYNGGGNVTPTPATLPFPVSDPLAALVSSPGSPGSCNGSGPTTYAPSGQNASVTVPSGSYPCGLTLSPNTSGTVYLSGLYLIGGSGLTISSGGFTVSGSVIGTSGVTLYISGANAGVSINADAGTTFDGAIVQLQAPSDSSQGIPGVVLFQDSNDPTSAIITLAGFATPPSQDSYLWGAVYAPSATLTLTGIGNDNPNPQFDECSTLPRLTAVVANKLVLNQNLNFSVNDCGPPVPVSTPVPGFTQSAVLVK
jgi:hypothetical protein